MKVNELKEDTYIKEWLEALNATDNTERNYLQGMQFFTECVKKTPEELILEAEAEVRSRLSGREKSLKKHLVGFRKQLQEKALAPMTVRTHLTGVKSFYKNFDIEIPSLPKAGNKVTTLEKNKAIPNKDDLYAVLKVCDPLERAILLLGASSGLSCEDIINLKVSNFKNGYESKTEITTLELRRIKTKVDFVTFLSPEASRAVQDYLSYRERTAKTGEERRQPTLEKQNVFSNDNYLFIGRHILDSFLDSRDDKERQIQEKGFSQIFRNLSEKACKNAVKGNWNLIRSHNIRRFFNSALLNAGCDSFHVEFFMGHKLDATKTAYFRANIEQLKEIYTQYIPRLTIQKEADISESPAYLKLKADNQILTTETAKHVIERSELQDLRSELETAKTQNEQLRKDMYEELRNIATNAINKTWTVKFKNDKKVH